MTSIGSYDAKTNLPKLLERVEGGETIQITRRGVPIAKLVPITAADKSNPTAAAQHIREIRKGILLGSMSLRDLIQEGRR